MSQAQSWLTALNASPNAVRWLCVSKSHSWGSPTQCPLVIEVLSQNCGDEDECLPLHRADWSFVVSLPELAKPDSSQWRKKQKPLCSQPSVTEGCIEHLGRLAPSEDRMNWIVSHRSSVGYVSLKSSCCHVGQTIWSKLDFETGYYDTYRGILGLHRWLMTWRWRE